MTRNSDLRLKVAKEAATLLYLGAEKEYKQAKLKAARTLAAHFLPTNLEVAMELDKIAEALEGSSRKERLILMRKEALKIMQTLKQYSPILIGSVWRGTALKGSDIDITVYNDAPDEILNLMEKSGEKIFRTEWTTVTKKGKTKESLHVYAETSNKQIMEIVIRRPDEADYSRKCEIFGDEIKGLSLQELKTVLEEKPAQKFVPE